METLYRLSYWGERRPRIHRTAGPHEIGLGTVVAVPTTPRTEPAPGAAPPVVAPPAGDMGELLGEIPDTLPAELAETVLAVPELIGPDDSFYRLIDRSLGERGGVEVRREHVDSTRWTAGPWDPLAQHGGPPAALLGRAVSALPGPDGVTMTVSRLTVDLLGPIPVAPLTVSARVLRPGRTVDLVEAELIDPQQGRPVARGTAWRAPLTVDGPLSTDPGEPAPPGPAQGYEAPWPASWHGGYLDAMRWAWVSGSMQPGPAVVWMQPLVHLVDDEPWTPLTRVLVSADSANGISAAVDPAAYSFLNTELTVHVTRPLRGDWVGLSARTVLGGGSVGAARATIWDGDGVVGASAAALLVQRR
jgi:acyl-coenzyme A thioesterase PaaI-like protein